jgi:hypothetical protein
VTTFPTKFVKWREITALQLIEISGVLFAVLKAERNKKDTDLLTTKNIWAESR